MNDEIMCPYCGGDGEAIMDAKTLWYSVVCDECDASIGDRYTTEANAIAAWNTRSITAALALPKIAALVDAVKEVRTDWDAKTAAGMVWGIDGLRVVGNGPAYRLSAALAAIETLKGTLK